MLIHLFGKLWQLIVYRMFHLLKTAQKIYELQLFFMSTYQKSKLLYLLASRLWIYSQRASLLILKISLKQELDYLRSALNNKHVCCSVRRCILEAFIFKLIDLTPVILTSSGFRICFHIQFDIFLVWPACRQHAHEILSEVRQVCCFFCCKFWLVFWFNSAIS